LYSEDRHTVGSGDLCHPSASQDRIPEQGATQPKPLIDCHPFLDKDGCGVLQFAPAGSGGLLVRHSARGQGVVTQYLPGSIGHHESMARTKHLVGC
jgi:hypothetical protein